MAKKFKEILSHTYTCGIKGTPADLDPINLQEDSIMITNFRRYVDAEVPVPVTSTLDKYEGVPGDVVTMTIECDLDATGAKVSVELLKGARVPSGDDEPVTISGKTITAKFELAPIDAPKVNAIIGVVVNGIRRIVVVPVVKVDGVLSEPEVGKDEIKVGEETTITVKVTEPTA